MAFIDKDDLQTICNNCFGDGEVNDEPCEKCDGYGHFLTHGGRILIEFLESRSIAVPMSPKDEWELQGTLE